MHDRESGPAEPHTCRVAERDDEAGRPRVSVGGDLTLADAPGLLAVLARALVSRPDAVVLDLGHLDSIDRRCVDMVAATGSRMMLWGGALSVEDARGAVRRAFGTRGLGDLLRDGAMTSDRGVRSG